MISQRDDQHGVVTLGDDIPGSAHSAPSLSSEMTEFMKESQAGHDEEDIDDEQPYGWAIVAAAFFVQAIIVGTTNGYGIYQDRYIHHEYSTSTTFQLAWVGTLNVVGMELTGPITGQIVDHFGYKICAFTGAIIMCASLFATSFSKQVWQLYIFQGLMYGFGASLSYFPSLSLPSQWFKRRRGFATGIVVAGGGFGGLVISPVTTALFDKIGYSWTVRLMALVHLAVIIPAVVLFRTRIETGKAKAKRLKREQSDRELAMKEIEKEDKGTSLEDAKMKESQAKSKEDHSVMDFDMLKDKRLLLLTASSFFVACGYYCPYFFITTYAQSHGTSASTAALLIGILNGSSAVGRVSMGLASDYMGDVNCIKRLASVTGFVYGGIALGALIGSPVGGALLDLSQGTNYLSVQLWSGLALIVSTLLTVALKLMINPKLFGRA
ncbi:hypothetical protein BGZ82_011538 [Podila clonocystis]|nr:hypothetical protein BGZ82_011538 [Podila clonocystis]